jgi:hypothetical protein
MRSARFAAVDDGRSRIGDRSRKAVPVEELWRMTLDLGQQLRDLPDGAKVRIVVKE